jgi:hypothetical protein
MQALQIDLKRSPIAEIFLWNCFTEDFTRWIVKDLGGSVLITAW